MLGFDQENEDNCKNIVIIDHDEVTITNADYLEKENCEGLELDDEFEDESEEFEDFVSVPLKSNKIEEDNSNIRFSNTPKFVIPKLNLENSNIVFSRNELDEGSFDPAPSPFCSMVSPIIRQNHFEIIQPWDGVEYNLKPPENDFSMNEPEYTKEIIIEKMVIKLPTEKLASIIEKNISIEYPTVQIEEELKPTENPFLDAIKEKKAFIPNQTSFTTFILQTLYKNKGNIPFDIDQSKSIIY